MAHEKLAVRARKNAIAALWNKIGPRMEAAAALMDAESDRGCALVGAALVDEALQEILSQYFEDAAIAKKLLDINAPLGTFSARINIAYAIGLIGAEVRSELDTIRAIRNSAAHFPRDKGEMKVSFETASIKDRCRHLMRRDRKVSSARVAYIDTCSTLAARFTIAATVLPALAAVVGREQARSTIRHTFAELDPIPRDPASTPPRPR